LYCSFCYFFILLFYAFIFVVSYLMNFRYVLVLSLHLEFSLLYLQVINKELNYYYYYYYYYFHSFVLF
jgi:hypothetical protein